MRSIPKLEMASHTRLDAIAGRPPDLVNLPDGCSFAPRCPNAQDRCLVDDPALTPDPDDPEHLFACHFPVNEVVVAAPGISVDGRPPRLQPDPTPGAPV
jgi:peptide/nickel transport system ATP-binding protein